MDKTPTTALYIRLSQEDDNVGESNSVKNQRDLLNDYVAKHSELSQTQILEFVDDGHSGTNFNRPAVTKMLEQVRLGKIHNIVVKDFSRFGRNYIEVGGYLEQVFPFLGVRFLSVTDLFDSNDNKGRSAGIEVGFKTLLHDLYSRDLSGKTKAGKVAKTKQGEHIGSTAPFGYIKSKAVKNAWEIDEPAAITVRKIFALALEGNSFVGIARMLNAEDLPTPYIHRKNNNTLHQVATHTVIDTPLWRKANVARILRDERYTGKNITNKIKKANNLYGNKKTQFLPESEWLVIPDAHEPIISQEDYDNAQSILGPINQRKRNRVKSTVFAGKIFCGHCRHALRHYRGRRPRYICQASKELGNDSCLPDTVFESSIAEMVMEALKAEISLARTAKRESDKQGKLLTGEHERFLRQAKELTLDVERLKNSREQLFEAYADGSLTKEQYLTDKAELSDRIADTEAEIARITETLHKKDHQTKSGNAYDILEQFSKVKEPTPAMMSLIDSIHVYSDCRIEIKFSFAR